MPTLEENLSVWGDSYEWVRAGEEWSKAWGSTRMQWYGSILPRISAFVPADSILEIAPGFGRWTNYLKDLCKTIAIVDISEKCIDACRRRFSAEQHISFHVNDGKSLDVVPDGSVDLVFSYDSLVHVEDVIMESYVKEISKKLKKNGVAFIHHSNLGDYEKRISLQSMLRMKDSQLSKIPKLPGLLKRLRIYDNVTEQWRARSMTAAKMAKFAQDSGLQCISQELITWNSRFCMVDCMSTLTPRNSTWYRENRILKNPGFMIEAKRLSELSRLYGWSP